MNTSKTNVINVDFSVNKRVHDYYGMTRDQINRLNNKRQFESGIYLSSIVKKKGA